PQRRGGGPGRRGQRADHQARKRRARVGAAGKMSNGTIHRMATEVEKQAPFATVEEAIDDLREGKFVVVVDAADRENEGDLTIAAQFATPEATNSMATHRRRLHCHCRSG